jgi:patched 1 protein
LAGAFGVPFNPTSTQVLPFLALGLGVDDMFVLTHTYSALQRRAESESDPVPDPIAITRSTMARAGPSITLTSVVNSFVFLVGALTPIPAVSSFCLQAAIVVCCNYLFLLFCFPGIIALDARRSAGGRMDLICCKKARTTSRVQAAKTDLGGSAAGGGLGGKFGGFLRGYFSLLAKPAWRLSVMAFFTIATGVSLYAATTVKSGLDISDIVPEDSYQGEFLAARFKYFDFFAIDIITQSDVDYTSTQTQIGLLEMHEELGAPA